jgi:hydrogenase-4 component F
LLAAATLTMRVMNEGSLLVGHEQFFVDPFNVFLVALTAFVGWTTSMFSRPYMRIEEKHGRQTPRGYVCITACSSCSCSRCCWRC